MPPGRRISCGWLSSSSDRVRGCAPGSMARREPSLEFALNLCPFLESPKRTPALDCSWVVVVLNSLMVTTDPADFSVFFAERYQRLVRACLLLTGNAAEGEDLAQEAMARVLERWDRVSTMDDPEGYLYRTALNLHRNALKRLMMRKEGVPRLADSWRCGL
jgi:hypothetical protein